MSLPHPSISQGRCNRFHFVNTAERYRPLIAFSGQTGGRAITTATRCS